jgi:hypothetical protein
MDFVMDGLATGRAVQVLTIVDTCQAVASHEHWNGSSSSAEHRNDYVARTARSSRADIFCRTGASKVSTADCETSV